ncbi:hypothetical protein WOLCODRAFT_135978 [Wolfiporia cocos MD-104 SS10]|uniref:BRCT domain-containing protein n=1 Tax=Wolfiporia cocos (strain MD-104) TaxID=742152 RepID=A0A2H3JJR4_WOLCO|nr:hypothetical protein WOLCODRAFT_135978 [Wolfiporia cocos MD-104 SS10]
MPAGGISRMRRQISSSPMSQDSFSELAPQDAGRLYIENTTAFNVPLSELGCDAVTSSQGSSIDVPSIRVHKTGSVPAIRRSGHPSATPFDRETLGTVLVASTPDPSPAGDSQSTSDHSHACDHSKSQESIRRDDTQLSDEIPQNQALTPSISHDITENGGQAQSGDYDHDNSREKLEQSATTVPSSSPLSTQTSSSYEHRFNPFSTDRLIATQPATQISDDVGSRSTHPSADIIQDTEPDEPDPLLNRPIMSHDSQPTTTTTTESKKTIRRGLLGMVSRNKWHMYTVIDDPPISISHPPTDHASSSPDMSAVAIGTSMEPTEPADNEATEPADDRSMHPAKYEPTQLVDYDNGEAFSSPPRPLRRQLPTKPVARKESEIVFGSEPAEMEVELIPPVKAAERVRSPAKPQGSIERALSASVKFTERTSPVKPRSGPGATQAAARSDWRSEDVALDSLSDLSDADTGGSSDDIPLAAANYDRQRKAQQPTRVAAAPEDTTVRSRVPAPPRPQIQENASTSARKSTVSGRMQNGASKARTLQKARDDNIVVPSSHPISDAADPRIGENSRYVPGRPQYDDTSAALRGRDSISSVHTGISRRTRRSTLELSDCETAVSGCGTILTDRADVETELADDDTVGSLKARVRPGNNGKRKRTISSTSSTSKLSHARASTRTGKRTTPPPRPAKRLKTTPLVGHDSDTPATRVFAVWKQDGHYYPGTVHSRVSAEPARYRIQFDDNETDVVDLSKMRIGRLQLGDQVIAVEESAQATVVDVSRLESDHQVTIEFDEHDRRTVAVEDLCIAARTLVKQWEERTLTAEEVVCLVMPVHHSPSVASVASTILRRPLTKVGLVVTMVEQKTRDRVVATIKNKGGIVIDDWQDIYTMEGTHSQGNKRWVVNQKDVRYTLSEKVDKLFLLSDLHSQTPKYLIALALGIPCLSTGWVLQATDDIHQNWRAHLLPAGFCHSLDTIVSQLIDWNWGNSNVQLTDIMANPVSSKLLNNASVLCLGRDFVPQPKSGRKNQSDEGNRMVPRIILAMGAASVEAVPDVKYAARADDLRTYDYVVIKDSSERTRAPGAKTVLWDWLKDCLIAGRILPEA